MECPILRSIIFHCGLCPVYETIVRLLMFKSFCFVLQYLSCCVTRSRGPPQLPTDETPPWCVISYLN